MTTLASATSPEPPQPWALRRTRFVCVSDTHNSTPKLPRGDVLIHAGDLTNQGSYSELSKAVQWLEKADFEAKIVVAGNHDVTLDRAFYSEYGAYFHNQALQSPDACLALLTLSPTITYLCHGSATIRLTDPRGPHTTFRVFGSPYSPRQGTWAFGYQRSESEALDPQHVLEDPATTSASDVWSSIPLDADVVVTHTPPYRHCDESVSRRRALGCEELRRALWRVRPRLAVCGHVHEGRGAERISWDISGERGSANVAYKEVGTALWDDPGAGPGNAKMSVVDLTGRGGKRALDNDGAHPAEPPEYPHGAGSNREGLSGGERNTILPGEGTLGLGGDPDVSARCDREALWGRMGRRETCVVNCSIMANSYPHVGGKRFNKPIVVDLDLPVWQ